jgi:hypothetical protein
MDIHFRYTDNSAPNFSSLFRRGYEKLTEDRSSKKSEAKPEVPEKPVDAPSKPTSEGWSPTKRARENNDRHAKQTKSSAEAVQVYTGKVVKATDGQPTVRPPANTRSKQWSAVGGERDRRRALPYQQETLDKRESPAMGRHMKKPVNPSEALGRHAAGPPPKNEAAGPQRMGRHARG